jgi:hypothetical protein
LETEPYREPATLVALRFALELIAWIAIYFAWGWIPLVFAVAALALLSVPGDKHMVVIKIAGPLRILVEAVVAAAGVIAAGRAWSTTAAGALLFAFAVLFAASRRRMRWLWQH